MPSGFEYVFNSLLERMHHVPYHRTDLLLDVEREIYASLEQVPDDVSGLIVLLKNQQMQGKNEKSPCSGTQNMEYRRTDLTLSGICFCANPVVSRHAGYGPDAVAAAFWRFARQY